VSSNSEVLSSKDIEDIILFNKLTVTKRGESFEVDRDDLYKLLNKINSYNNIQNRRLRIIKKATHILAGISYYQPFYDGNKETAHSTTILFLRRNGFNLPNTSNDRKEVYSLLIKTILKITNYPTIFSEVEEYLSKRVY
jgi:prophage maintenance system killer protein